jgi:hypothetical protein
VNRDFVEMLSALSAAKADYLVVGAHALAAHGIVRATGDLDIWVRSTSENADRVWSALASFGAPLDRISKHELTNDDVVYQIGIAPNRIDILTSISGVDFDTAWVNHVTIAVAGVQVPVLGKTDLIVNKRSAGRPQDLADVSALRKQTPRK